LRVNASLDQQQNRWGSPSGFMAAGFVVMLHKRNKNVVLRARFFLPFPAGTSDQTASPADAGQTEPRLDFAKIV